MSISAIADRDRAGRPGVGTSPRILRRSGSQHHPEGARDRKRRSAGIEGRKRVRVDTRRVPGWPGCRLRVAISGA